jgi:hypothetical protein
MIKDVYAAMRFTVAAAALFILASCHQNGPNLSGIKVDIKLDRFEKDFFALDTNNLEQGLTALNQKYPRFYPYFINDILALNNTQIADQNGRVMLNEAGKFSIRFFYRTYKNIDDSLQLTYKKLDWLKDELEEGFRHVKYYYPSYPVPEIVTFIGPFDAPGIAVTPKYLGIGLQQFAGRNFSVYKEAQMTETFPEYISRRFDKAYITVNCMKGIVDDIYPDTTETASLIEQMIDKGKQWYLLDKFLPGAPDSVKTGFTKSQTKFVKDNEGNIWATFLKDTPDPYTLDQERMQNYLGEGPFTQDMPHDNEGNGTPGNIGQWIGWQIVKKFADKNSGMTVQQVLSTPAKKIFLEAKYKPK